MARRWLVLSVIAAASAFSAAPAHAALAPLWTSGAGAGAVLCADGGGATAVWRDAGDGTLLAQRLGRGGDPRSASPLTLVEGVAGDAPWLAVSDRAGGVVVAWKTGGVTYVQGFDIDGEAAYAPVAVCSDAAVAAVRGTGATATPLQLAADAESGVYVRLAVAPSSPAGDTLLTHVGGTGVAAVPDPGLLVPRGTVTAMAADAQGHLAVLLGAPGRTGVAVQRFSTDLAAEWPRPVSPYDPLLSPAPAATQTPLALVATGGVVAAWREGAKVKVQRFTAAGERAWRRPVAVAAAGDARLAGDAFSGCYVVDAAGGGVRVRHVTAAGSLLGGGAGVTHALGLGVPQLGGTAVNAAGDLDVGYADGSAPTASGVVRFTYLGDAGEQASLAAGAPAALAADLVGGVYALTPGPAASTLARLGEPAAGVTLRPRTTRVVYGRVAGFAGFLGDAGVPLGAARLQLRWTRAGGTTPRVAVATLTSARGFYDLTALPVATATWEAIAPDLPDGPAVSRPFVLEVAPLVTLTLAHTGPRSRPREVFSGAVRPAHAGDRMLLQRRAQGTWRTIASGRLDAGSRYRIVWAPPARTATYTLRVILPAHTDHVRGTSPRVTLRVRVASGARTTD